MRHVAGLKSPGRGSYDTFLLLDLTEHGEAADNHRASGDPSSLAAEGHDLLEQDEKRNAGNPKQVHHAAEEEQTHQPKNGG